MLPENTPHCRYDPLVEFMRYYDDVHVESDPGSDRTAQPIEDRLARRIIDGDSIGLRDDLDVARRTYAPLDIINTILLSGMKTVGELFGSGQMQLPFVLHSAETMKTAVAYLERFMDRADSVQKGTMVLATVKGDVHDIGKNLVDIILTNNGYRVINLGIKVPIDAMLEAATEHHADAIGMSGLLVKSTVIMKENLELMQHRDLRIPVVLGGAALTRRYVEEDLRTVYDGPVAYANDAFDGLAFMEQVSAAKHQAGTDGPVTQTIGQMKDTAATSAHRPARPRPVEAPAIPGRRSSVATNAAIPDPPFLGSRIVTNIHIEKVFEYINEAALFRGQWQVRRGTMGDEEYADFVEREIRPAFERVKIEAKRNGVLRPAVVYGYFPCASDGDTLIVYRPKNLGRELLHSEWPGARYAVADLEPWQDFTFPRQSGDRHLCISDYFRPVSDGVPDVCAFHVVTMGAMASAYTSRLFEEHRYQEYLFMHGLSVECAEALAEYWHKAIREELGIAGSDAMELRRLFAQGYRGSRYSFGYPACPRLEDQRQVFELLQPERIGISLTEEWQLVPEQSTSAIIVHHPEAKYFFIK